VRRLLPLAVSLVLSAAAARASVDDPAPEPAILSVTVNGQSEGSTLVVRREGGRALLLRVEDLAQLRLRTPVRGLVTIDGERYLRLDAGDSASLEFDDAAQTVSVVLPPDAFLPTVDFVTPADAPRVTPAEPGAFVNYEMYGEHSNDRTSLGLYSDIGAFGDFGVATTSVIGRRHAGSADAVRLDTTWRRDFPEILATLRVGDSISVAGAWGRAARFGGVQFGTNYSTQPTLVTTPMLYAQGEAIVPSTVDVFVNGRRVATEDVPPGPFTIDRVPTVTGAGQMQVVVTDAFGRQQIVSQPFYSGPTLLRTGLSEYSVEAGAIREDYARSSNEYGDLTAAGTYRRGITDRFTAEVHAEGQAGGVAAAGVDSALQVGTLGILSLTAATGGNGDAGWLAGAGFERNGRRLSVYARARYSSESFAQLGTDPGADRPRRLTYGGMGVGFGRWGSVQASFGQQTYWSGARAQSIGLSHSVDIGRYGYLGLIASRSTGEDTTHQVFLNWSMSLGERRSVGTSLQYAPDAGTGETLEAVATLQQALPTGSGAGYYVSLSSSSNAQLDYTLQGSAGRVGVQYARLDESQGWRAGARGGVAITSAGIMPSRFLDESFAVVEVADYPGMTVYVENQPVARTDGRGRVLLDSLRAYESNKISIDPKELPLDASLASAATAVTPAYRSGPVVRFPVVRASAATLRLMLPDGSPVPAGAQVHTPHEEAPVAYDGLVYLAHASGHQQASAEWPEFRCTFAFERPQGGDPQPDLGEITCRPEGAP
jgi:outer membrane usher protein